MLLVTYVLFSGLTHCPTHQPCSFRFLMCLFFIRFTILVVVAAVCTHVFVLWLGFSGTRWPQDNTESSWQEHTLWRRSCIGRQIKISQNLPKQANIHTHTCICVCICSCVPFNVAGQQVLLLSCTHKGGQILVTNKLRISCKDHDNLRQD